jgi:cytoskeletal protein RodZ
MAWMRNRDNSGGQQKDYLNAADTAGRPMALASILFTLLFIAAIALLLFSAGRWAYNQMIDEEITVTTTQQEAAKTEDPANDVTVEPAPDNSVTADTTVTDSSSPSGSTEPADSSANSSSTTTAPITTATVPKTGPGSLLGIFAVTVLLATAVHYRYQVVKNR